MSLSALSWLTPTFTALFLYGIGQGLVKKYIAEVPPARFCLFFVVAKTVVNLGFFTTQTHPDPFASLGQDFFLVGLLAYTLDGLGWILYFQSIVAGPITIVGTLSAAYPALTVIFARLFLNETLDHWQYLGVVLVISGCIGLSYAPPDPSAKITKKRWIPLSIMALCLWGASQTLMKYSYRLPGASEVNMALFNTLGGALTLGLYGLVFGRSSAKARHTRREWRHSFIPMAMMAGGDLSVIIASRHGPISIVTPLTAAYPLVTLGFASVVLKEKITRIQWLCILAILTGMFLSPGAAG